MVPIRTTNIERKGIIQCPKINDTQLRVTPPNQGSYNPRSPNKSAERIGKITEPPQIGRTNRRNRPNSAANFFLGGGVALSTHFPPLHQPCPTHTPEHPDKTARSLQPKPSTTHRLLPVQAPMWIFQLPCLPTKGAPQTPGNGPASGDKREPVDIPGVTGRPTPVRNVDRQAHDGAFGRLTLINQESTKSSESRGVRGGGEVTAKAEYLCRLVLQGVCTVLILAVEIVYKTLGESTFGT